MKNINIEKILLSVLRIGLVLGLLAPVVVSFGFLFPYIVPRAAFFQMIMEFLLAVAVVLVVFFPRNRPKWTFLSAALAIYFLVVALTTFTAQAPTRSFIGTIERSLGFFHLFHYAVLFFIAKIAFKTQKQWNIFFWIMLVISLYPSIDFILGKLSNLKSAPPSVMGNPTFLAAYLIFHMFFAAYLIMQLDKKNHVKKTLLGIIIIVHFLSLILTGVRGGAVGVGAGVIYIALYAIYKSQKWRFYIIGGIFILMIFAAAIYINRGSDLIKKTPVIGDFTNFSLQDDTIRSRFIMWGTAWKGFKEKPIFGWGMENYSFVFNKYFNPAFDQLSLGESWEDRSHNVIFDEMITGGIIRLIAYFSLLISAFFAVHKKPLWTALLIAYIVQNMFGVDSLNSYIPFFIFLALIDHKEESSTETSYITNPILTYGVSTVALVAIAASFIFFTYKPAAAITNMHQAYFYIANNNYQSFISSYNKSKTLSKNFPSYQLESIGIVSSGLISNAMALVQQNSYSKYANLISSDMENLLKNFPLEQRWKFNMAHVFMQIAVVENDKQLLEKAEQFSNELLAAAPSKNIFILLAEKIHQIKEALFKK